MYRFKSGRRLPVLFMRSLFVPPSSISQRGSEIFSFRSSWEIDTFSQWWRRHRRAFFGPWCLPLCAQVQCKTMVGGDGGGCPDHPVIHIIPCCWGTRPHHACMWCAVYTFSLFLQLKWLWIKLAGTDTEKEVISHPPLSFPPSTHLSTLHFIFGCLLIGYLCSDDELLAEKR